MIPLLFDTKNKKALRVLCLGAHGDDIEIGCGGALLKLIDSRLTGAIQWVVCTSNDLRKQEAQASAERFLEGVAEKEICILDFPDAFLPARAEAVKTYFETLKSFQPDVVFTHYREDLHQDHRLVSELTWNTFRDHLILEYEIPKYDGDLGHPNSYCTLTEDQALQKVELLLRAFPSQQGKHWFERETFLGLMRIRGLESGSSARYAEAFYARKWIW